MSAASSNAAAGKIDRDFVTAAFSYMHELDCSPISWSPFLGQGIGIEIPITNLFLLSLSNWHMVWHTATATFKLVPVDKPTTYQTLSLK